MCSKPNPTASITLAHNHGSGSAIAPTARTPLPSPESSAPKTRPPASRPPRTATATLRGFVGDRPSGPAQPSSRHPQRAREAGRRTAAFRVSTESGCRAVRPSSASPPAPSVTATSASASHTASQASVVGCRSATKNAISAVAPMPHVSPARHGGEGAAALHGLPDDLEMFERLWLGRKHGLRGVFRHGREL